MLMRRSQLLNDNGLPNKYQEVTYLQNSGTQWIKTNTINNITNKLSITLKYQFTTTNSDKYFGGNINSNCRNTLYCSTTAGTYYWFLLNNSTTYISFNCSNNTIYEDNFTRYGTSATLSGSHTASKASVGNASLLNGSVIGLFSESNGTRPATLRIYRAIISVDDKITYNFIPCYRKQDSVAGMYDLVKRTFYTNAGTGTFIIGAKI